MATRKRRVRGVASVRKLLRQLPDAAADEMVVELNVTGRDILSRILGRTPVRKGALKSGMSYKVFAKTLKLQVGLLGTKAGRSKLFYGRIQEFGRRAQTVTVRRFRAGGQRLYFRGSKFGPAVQTYAMHVRFMAGKFFVHGRMPDLRAALQRNLKKVWQRALRRFTGLNEFD